MGFQNFLIIIKSHIRITIFKSIDDEPATIAVLDKYAADNGYKLDMAGPAAIAKSISLTQKKQRQRN